MSSSPKDDLRQFYRNSGMVYLAVFPAGHGLPSAHEPEEKDTIALRLMNLHNQLDYHSPENSDMMRETLKVLGDLYRNCREPDAARFPLLRKQAVVISGSGMDFLSEKKYAEGQMLSCLLNFPGYPFVMLDFEAQVIRCEEMPGHHRYKVAVSFDNIPERARDHVVQYVNWLTRQQRTKDIE